MSSFKRISSGLDLPDVPDRSSIKLKTSARSLERISFKTPFLSKDSVRTIKFTSIQKQGIAFSCFHDLLRKNSRQGIKKEHLRFFPRPKQTTHLAQHATCNLKRKG